MKKIMTAASLMILLSLVLSACSLSAAAPTEMSPDQISTIAKATVDALTTQMAPPPATATPIPVEPTATATLELPTLAPIPTLGIVTATPTLLALPTTAAATGGQCYQAYFVKESPADGAVYTPGAAFVKKWTIRNDGTCTWDTRMYAGEFSDNPTSPVITGENTYRLKGQVVPGGFLEITANMKAPTEAGTYTQVWKLYDPDGKPFGLKDGSGWWVNIVVSKTGDTATMTIPTGIDTVTPGNGLMGSTVTVTGTVGVAGMAAGGSQTVRYSIVMGGKTMAGCENITTAAFTTNTTLAFSHDCVVPDGFTSGDVVQVKVYVNSPAGQKVNSTGTFTID